MSTPLLDSVEILINEPSIPARNAAQRRPVNVSWDAYVGQEPIKAELRIYIKAALRTGRPLPHTIFSGPPGTGKTALARAIAEEMDANLFMLVPPFTAQTLYEAVLQQGDHDILFIDEIHKLADRGPALPERLLHIMAEGMLYLEDAEYELRNFTLMGATTNAAKLPSALLDRFGLKPRLERYTMPEMVKIIVTNFCRELDVTLPPETVVAIAKASRYSPREARRLVEGAHAIQEAMDRPCMPDELLGMKRLEPDGTTRQHISYLCVLYQFFGRERDDRWEYVAGEASLMNVLDEDKPGLATLERFLIERGLVDRTPRGRRLTDRGVARARDYVARGLGRGTE